MTCTNFQITNLESSYSLPPVLSPALTPKNPTLHLTLTGISSSCSGKYSAELFSGNVLADVGGDATLDLEVASAPLRGQIYTNNNTNTGNNNEEELPFPTLAILSKCSTTFSVSNLQFTGSISSKIIGLFSGMIKDKLTEGLNSHICSLIKKNAEAGIEKGLNVVGRYVAGIVYDPQRNEGKDAETSLEGEDESTGLVRLQEGSKVDLEQKRLGIGNDSIQKSTDKRVRWDRDMPLLTRILTASNNFISRHINEGLILQFLSTLNTWPETLDPVNCDDCGFLFKGLNGFIKSLTKGSGELSIPIPEKVLNIHRNYTFDIANYGNVTIVARQLKIGGLDNLTSLQLFHPKGDNMLSSAISSDAGLNVTLFLDLTVTPANDGEFHAGMLNESFQVSFDTSALDASFQSAVELDAEIYKRLSVGSFMFGSYTMFESNKNALHCIFEVLSSVVFTNMNAKMNLDALHVIPVLTAGDLVVKDNNLEDDIDQLINNVMQMLLLHYPVTVTESLSALIRRPARLLLNQAFAGYISLAKSYPLHCANVDIPDKKIAQPMELDKNGAIVLFNEVFNKESTIDAINSFIECVHNVITTNKLFAGHFYNISVGEYTLVFHDLQFMNLNSVYELGLLHPEIDSYHLDNKIGYGKRDSSRGDTTMSVGMNILQDKKAVGNVVVHIHMTNLRINAATELKFDMNWLPQLKITDLLSRPQCISIPVTEMSFYGFNARVDDLHLEISAVMSDGVSPGTSTSYITNNSTELALLMSNLMTTGAKLLENQMIGASHSLMEEGTHVCRSPANPQRTLTYERSTKYAGLWTFLVVLSFLIGNALLFMRGFKDDNTTNGDVGSPENVTRPIATSENEEEKKSGDAEFTR